MSLEKPRRKRWCPKCRALVEWAKCQPLGARARFRGCVTCGSRTSRAIPRSISGRKKKRSGYTLDQLDAIARKICYHQMPVCMAAGLEGFDCKGPLEWAHIIGRDYHRTRWDEDNCFRLCAAHHNWYTKHHVHWELFVHRKIGESKHRELKHRALDPTFPKPDRAEIYARLVARAAALGVQA